MKTLILSAAKVSKIGQLILVIFALNSAPVFAGGDDNAKMKLSDSESYARALIEMAEALNEMEELQNIYVPKSQIKIYDVNYNLVKEADLLDDGSITDDELLVLMHQSTELIQFENVSYYIMNE